MKNNISQFIMLILMSVYFVVAVHSENWPNWRGPYYNGSTTATNLPTSWSKTKNIAWKTPLPGASAATPIIWENRIFLTSVDNQTRDILALCIDRRNGEILWQDKIGIDFGSGGRRRSQNKASPSPVTDGQNVFFLCGTGDLAAYKVDGTRLWSRKLMKDYGKFAVQFGYASSPLLYKNKLYILVLQRNSIGENNLPRDSFLLALDPTTGKELWKHIRPSDARRESLEAYTTPIPFEHKGRSEILIMGGDYITGHSPDNGKELWRWGNYNPRKIAHWRIVPSAVAGAGHIFVAAPKRQPLYAIAAGGKGKLNDESITWKLTEFTPDVCTPLMYDNRLYVYDGDRYVMTCLDPKTGEKKWRAELGGDTVYRASPTGGDGKIYCVNEAGLVVVLEADDTKRELFRYNMGEGPIRSSIAISKENIFIRTAENLYCIGNKQE